MEKWKLIAGVAALALLAAGCERSSAVATGTSASAAAGAASVSGAGARESAAEAPVPLASDGKALWSASRKGTAEENAQRSFERNGADFGARDLDDFVRKAHDFVEHPPKGTETLKRANGDTLFYDRAHNIFAVANKDGAPRTLFKPDEGAAYWDKQKASEARRQAARDSRRAEADS